MRRNQVSLRFLVGLGASIVMLAPGSVFDLAGAAQSQAAVRAAAEAAGRDPRYRWERDPRPSRARRVGVTGNLFPDESGQHL